MKVCTKCSIEKSLNEFYKRSQNKDGLDSRCKACNKKICKTYRENNAENIKKYKADWFKKNYERLKEKRKTYYEINSHSILESNRIWIQNNIERYKDIKKQYQKKNKVKLIEKRKEWVVNNKDKISELHKKDYKKNKKKHMSRGILNKAVKSNEIIRGVCAKCGESKVEGHHFDYSKPLDVIWLCIKHHHRLHEEERKGNFPPYLGD